MDGDWTRRQFLQVAVKGPLLLAAGGAAVAEACSGEQPSVPGTFSRAHGELLSAAMDEIIPEGAGMPSASAVGGLEYIERLVQQVPSLKGVLEEAAAKLDAASHQRLSRGFLRLARSERVQILSDLEGQAGPEAFGSLRDAVYEAYYTNPRVWTLIGYDPAPTSRPGPRMKPFDEGLLARVKALPNRYREVG